MQESTGGISVGSKYEEVFSYTQEDVLTFAEISGDKNPIHLDDEYAAKSIFKRRIIHGYLGTSIFSKVFAMSFPGEGTIYLKQDLKFLKPMFANEEYKASFEIIEHLKERKRALVKTIIQNQSDELVVVGEALIQNATYL